MAKRRGQGEGHLEELRSGKWRAVYTNGTKPDGKQRKVTSPAFDTRKEANTWLQGQLEDLRKGKLIVEDGRTFGDWSKSWLANLNLRPSTLRAYRKSMEDTILPCLGESEIRKITPLWVHRVYAEWSEKGYAISRRRLAAAVLSSCLGAANRMRLIYTNPAAQVDLPRKETKEYSCWTKPEATQFLASCQDHRMFALFALALDSGMRQGELLGLHWPQVDLCDGSVFVQHTLHSRGGEFELYAPKTKAGKRRIWVGQCTLDALRRHREAMWQEGRDIVRGPVFVSRRGTWLWKEVIQRQFARLMNKSGVPVIRFHDLRHTSATLLLQAGVGIKTVSQRLGHANISITLSTYAHVLPGEQRQVAAVADRIFGQYPAAIPPSEAAEQVYTSEQDAQPDVAI